MRCNSCLLYVLKIYKSMMKMYIHVVILFEIKIKKRKKKKKKKKEIATFQAYYLGTYTSKSKLLERTYMAVV